MIWNIIMLALFLAGILQFSTWTDRAIRWAWNLIEQRAQLRHALKVAAILEAGAAQALPVVIEARPTPEFIVTFWNGCAMPIDRGSEQGRLALASGLLLRSHWHRRPRA